MLDGVGRAPRHPSKASGDGNGLLVRLRGSRQMLVPAIRGMSVEAPRFAEEANEAQTLRIPLTIRSSRYFTANSGVFARSA